jgi:hypothetical protein
MKAIKRPEPRPDFLTPWEARRFKWIIGETVYEQYLLVKVYDEYKWISISESRVTITDWNRGEKNTYKDVEKAVTWFLEEIKKSKCFASDSPCELKRRIENYVSVRD